MLQSAQKPVPVRIQEQSWLARLAAKRLRAKRVAMVIGRTIYLYGATRAEFLGNRAWLLHELQHVAQYEEYGRMRFVAMYMAESLRVGYYNNRLETDARAAETDPGLLKHFVIQPSVQENGTDAISAQRRLSSRHSSKRSMPRKIPPTAGQKRLFMIHVVIFAVAVTAMFLIHASQEKAAGTWVYPWHAWPVAAWALAVIGHWCALWTTYEDKGLDEFNKMVQNG